MQIKVKRLSDKAVMPIKSTSGAAGFDLTATDITTEINEAGELILVYHTGLAIEIPKGYYGQLMMRSSVSNKTIVMCNAAGVIDSDYRGEIIGKFRSTVTVVPAVYKVPERFAQLLILPLPDVTFVESSELSDSDRGEDGFGSTDKVDNENTSAPSGSAESQNIVEETAEQTATEVAAGDVDAPEQAE